MYNSTLCNKGEKALIILVIKKELKKNFKFLLTEKNWKTNRLLWLVLFEEDNCRCVDSGFFISSNG